MEFEENFSVFVSMTFLPTVKFRMTLMQKSLSFGNEKNTIHPIRYSKTWVTLRSLWRLCHPKSTRAAPEMRSNLKNTCLILTLYSPAERRKVRCMIKASTIGIGDVCFCFTDFGKVTEVSRRARHISALVLTGGTHHHGDAVVARRLEEMSGRYFIQFY